MPPPPSTTYQRLRQYIAERMRMSPIYAAVDVDGVAGPPQPGPRAGHRPPDPGRGGAQIETYTERVKRMVVQVLTGNEAIGMLQALFFGLMEKAESPQGERESRSDPDENRGWRRCRCSSGSITFTAQRETA